MNHQIIDMPDLPGFYPSGFCSWVNFGDWLINGRASDNCPRRFMTKSKFSNLLSLRYPATQQTFKPSQLG